MKRLLTLVLFGFMASSMLKAKVPYFQNDSLLHSDLEVVWPMILTVKIEYDLANAQLEFLVNKSEKEQFLEEFEGFIKEKYFKRVMDLNYKQGKLLLLLIHRQLGKTPYELLREYRNIKRANFWQRFAKLMGTNLKEEYDPEDYPVLEHEIILMQEAGIELLQDQ